MPLRNRAVLPSPSSSVGSVPFRRRLLRAFDLLGLADPRAARRFPCTFPLRYGTPEDDGVLHTGVALNLSTAGLRLLTSHPLARDAALMLQLPRSAARVSPALAYIVYSLPTAGSAEGWMSGALFACPLTADQVQTLLAAYSG